MVSLGNTMIYNTITQVANRQHVVRGALATSGRTPSHSKSKTFNTLLVVSVEVGVDLGVGLLYSPRSLL